MTNNIINHFRLSLQRSKFYDDTIIARILKSIGYVAMFVYAIVFGLFLDQILISIAPEMPLSLNFFYLALLGWLIDFFLKLILKSSKIYNVIPYITLPIPLRQVFNVELKNSVFSVLNFIGLVALLPFFIKMVICGRISVFAASGFTLLTFSFSLINSALVRFVKSFVKFQVTVFVICLSLIFILFVYLAFNFDIVPQSLLMFMRNTFFVYMLAILTMFIAYILALSQCRREFYKISEMKTQNHFSVLNASNYALNGLNPIVKLSLQMFFRNKTGLIPLILFQLTFILGFWVASQGYWPTWFAPMFVFGSIIIFISGFSPFTYYASYAFDGLQTNVNEFTYKMAIAYHKIWIICSAIITLIYILIYQDYLLFITCGLSVSLFEYVYLNGIIYAKKRVDLLRSFSQTNSVDFRVVLCGFEAILIVASFIVLYSFFNKEITCIVFSLISIIFLLTSKHWIRNIFRKFMQHRYENMSGFRNEY
ncbi:MAG: DUF5687 family protein [Bacteroidales bacterium]|nr:DUF5687 family protein [Bacteroidales bacterium]